MSADEWLRFVHIVAAGVWLGTGVALLMLVLHARRTGEELSAIKSMEWIGPKIGPAVSIALVGSGVAMVVRSSAWSFDQFWLLAGVVIFAALLLIGLGFHAPQYRRIDAAVGEHGAGSVRIRRLVSQSLLAVAGEIMLLAAAVWVMVAKVGL